MFIRFDKLHLYQNNGWHMSFWKPPKCPKVESTKAQWLEVRVLESDSWHSSLHLMDVHSIRLTALSLNFLFIRWRYQIIPIPIELACGLVEIMYITQLESSKSSINCYSRRSCYSQSYHGILHRVMEMGAYLSKKDAYMVWTVFHFLSYR